METSAEERRRLDDYDGMDGFAATRAKEMSDAPPLLLAGADEDGTEAHICRGID
ncbi:MAG: hypothetical protein JO362_18790 [Streptomycetaceae bacterium]|nr:hypothetical protein [Streptomycetaceae bacterium]